MKYALLDTASQEILCQAESLERLGQDFEDAYADDISLSTVVLLTKAPVDIKISQVAPTLVAKTKGAAGSHWEKLPGYLAYHKYDGEIARGDTVAELLEEVRDEYGSDFGDTYFSEGDISVFENTKKSISMPSPKITITAKKKAKK